MVLQVLSPQDCLRNPLTSRQVPLPPLIKYPPKPNPSPNPKPNHKPNPNQTIRAQPDRQKKRKPSRSNNTNSLPARSDFQKIHVANDQLSGQVKILKRGEGLTKPAAPHQPSPAPKKKRPSQKVQELRFYAGSCTSSASPPPSSLPLPSFLAKKRVVSNTGEVQGVAKASTA
ncbi:early nodulin-20-like [Rosa chinensis]|uniref:early nodulin-20-like n=1 Tax=Rosa chinensis TaxID=74649 RepID=UPI000D08B5CF|nr:early nodulin-20-like [Rosa chinensis]